jgi:UPF0716 family protein affecting phage T7 exclusion
MDDDSTFGGLGPLTAILVVLAFALLGSLLVGAAGTRRHRDPQPADGAPAAAMPARRRHGLAWRVTAWTLRQIADSFT